MDVVGSSGRDGPVFALISVFRADTYLQKFFKVKRELA